MPKNNKKGKAATAKADKDFGDMLDEFRTADMTNPAISPSTPTTTSSSSISSSVLSPSVPAIERTVLEVDMVQAVIRGDMKQLKRWARQGVCVRTARPLCQAAASGKIGVVQCLVKELEADVNLGDEVGCTPLFMAAQEGQTAVVRCLVRQLGADVDKASHVGTAPLHVAVLEGHLDTTRCFLKELGADVNQATRLGVTPCHVASTKGNLRMLHCLVKEFSADVNKANENRSGFTPLLVAIEKGHLHVVRSLIEDLGADVNKASRNGQTPLMKASYHKHAKIVYLLTKHCADSQVRAPYFGTAADVSSKVGAPAELTAYLEAKMHCSNPGCSGAGIKKCTGCKQVRYCGQTCQLAHWPVHKAACRAQQAKGCKA
jgi:ankyrin repeat protein